LSAKFYLEKDFRMMLFSKAYKNAGESLGNMALLIGYFGAGRNGHVRNMWLGRTHVYSTKIWKIAKLANISEAEVKKHMIEEQNNIEVYDWNTEYEKIKNKI